MFKKFLIVIILFTVFINKVNAFNSISGKTSENIVIVKDSVYYYINVSGNLTLFAGEKNILFDSDGNALLRIYQLWYSGEEKWKNSELYETEYDEFGNKVSEIKKVRDSGGNTWVNSQYFSYDYDNGKLTGLIFKTWDNVNLKWINEYKKTYIYGSGNITKYSYFIWDNILNNWKEYEKNTYSYDFSGNLTSSVYMIRDTIADTLVYSEREINTYNGNLISVKEQQTWDEVSSSWVDDIKFSYFYDSFDLATEITVQSFDNSQNSWIYTYKYLYDYDYSGNIISETGQYPKNGTTWVNEYRLSYTYNANGNPLKKTRQFWNTETNEWVDSYQYVYTYDTYGKMTSVTFSYWNKDTNSWHTSYKNEFFWSDFDPDIKLPDEITLYPNPATAYIYIADKNLEIDYVEILDISGKNIYVKTFSEYENRKIYIGNLSAGIYMARIKLLNDQIVLRKFIKILK